MGIPKSTVHDVLHQFKTGHTLDRHTGEAGLTPMDPALLKSLDKIVENKPVASSQELTAALRTRTGRRANERSVEEGTQGSRLLPCQLDSACAGLVATTCEFGRRFPPPHRQIWMQLHTFGGWIKHKVAAAGPYDRRSLKSAVRVAWASVSQNTTRRYINYMTTVGRSFVANNGWNTNWFELKSIK